MWIDPASKPKFRTEHLQSVPRVSPRLSVLEIRTKHQLIHQYVVTAYDGRVFSRETASYRPRRRRRGLTSIAIGIAALYIIVTWGSTVWTDYLWFDQQGFSGVWSVLFLVPVGLVVAFSLVAFFVLWVNLVVAGRISPLALSEDEQPDELAIRYRGFVEDRLGRLRLLGAAGLGLTLGLGAGAWRDDVLRFFAAETFGTVDPIFKNDVGFYVFRLPIIADLVGWLTGLLVVTLLAVAAVHYLNVGLRLRGRRIVSSRGVKTHLSILLALLALVRAAAYRIDGYQLLTSTEGTVFGAGYTDFHVRLPAFNLLALISIVAAVLFLANIGRLGWTLVSVTAGGWLVVGLIVGVLIPTIFQQLRVTPNAQTLEQPFIKSNIEFTRSAYGLDEVQVVSFAASPDLKPEDVEANRETLDALRLWDTGTLSNTFNNLQSLFNFSKVDKVDVDRYLVDGVPQQVMVGLRELRHENVPETWVNQYLNYTHGFGAVVSSGNRIGDEGRPEFILSGVPPKTTVDEFALTEPRVYFGEAFDPDVPVLAKTGDTPQEIDYNVEGRSEQHRYAGAGGVPFASPLRRLAFALRFRDLNMILNNSVRPDTVILMQRNIASRLNELAPFLEIDGNPYPVIIDGGIVWIADLYTVSRNYPYSRPLSGAEDDRLPRAGTVLPGINYIRNSVKATIDAYDGTVRLYVMDPADPLIRSYRRLYPELFLDRAEMPSGLEAHLRFPEDLFVIQTEMYREYHVIDPVQFYQRTDAWGIPEDPSTPGRRGSGLLRGDGQTDPATGRQTVSDKMQPYYMQMAMPLPQEEGRQSFVILQPFTPRSGRNMTSFLVADSTPGTYGRIIDFRIPAGRQVDGTGQVRNRIDNDDEISAQRTLWDQQGSQVIFGDMLVVPVADSVLYVQPVFLAAEGGSLPEFRRAIVVLGDQVVFEPSIGQALDKLFGTDGDGQEPPPPDPGQDTASLLKAAEAAFAQAQLALTDGNLAEYQRLIDEARRLVQQALGQLAV